MTRNHGQCEVLPMACRIQPVSWRSLKPPWSHEWVFARTLTVSLPKCVCCASLVYFRLSPRFSPCALHSKQWKWTIPGLHNSMRSILISPLRSHIELHWQRRSQYEQYEQLVNNLIPRDATLFHLVSRCSTFSYTVPPLCSLFQGVPFCSCLLHLVLGGLILFQLVTVRSCTIPPVLQIRYREQGASFTFESWNMNRGCQLGHLNGELWTGS